METKLLNYDPINLDQKKKKPFAKTLPAQAEGAGAGALQRTLVLCTRLWHRPPHRRQNLRKQTNSTEFFIWLRIFFASGVCLSWRGTTTTLTPQTNLKTNKTKRTCSVFGSRPGDPSVSRRRASHPGTASHATMICTTCKNSLGNIMIVGLLTVCWPKIVGKTYENLLLPMLRPMCNNGGSTSRTSCVFFCCVELVILLIDSEKSFLFQPALSGPLACLEMLPTGPQSVNTHEEKVS